MINKTPLYLKPAPDEPCPCLRGAAFGDCCGADESTPPMDVIIKKHALPDKRCDEMVKYLNKQPRTDCVVGRANELNARSKALVNSHRITHEVKMGKLKPKIKNLVATEFSNLVEKQLGKTPFWYQGPGVLLYVKGCWYAAHADAENFVPQANSWRRDVDRDYSMLFYLSDKFEGGNITFNRFGFSYKPEKGDLIIFPSDNRYLHTAEEVTEGHRYAVVAFCSTKESIKVQPRPPEDAVFFRDEDKVVAYT